MEWYILHVHIGRENAVVEILRNKLNTALYRPFIPKQEIFFRRAGVTSIQTKHCFSGYIFVESKTTAERFLDDAEGIIRSIKEVYSVLSYDGKKI